jgi:alpha-L-glutamate ligase-like protein
MFGRARRWLDSFRPDVVVGINRRNAELIYPHNARRNYRFGDDKLLAKAHLQAAGVPVPATLAVCDGLYAVDRTIDVLVARDTFVVKPSRASGGAGILALTGRDASGAWLTAGGTRVDRDRLRKHLADIVFGAFGNELEDVAYAEICIQAHPSLQAMWSEGLADVRVLTLKGLPFMAMLRIPTRGSDGRANLHQGGIGAAIDLGTGRITRALCRGQLVDTHPDSGSPLVGGQIPNWPEVLHAASRAALAVPLGYLGVDLVIDHAGRPLVLEINVRPGIEIQNVHGRSIEDALRGALP